MERADIAKNKEEDDPKSRILLSFETEGPMKSLTRDFVETCIGYAITSFYGVLGSAKFSIQVLEVDGYQRTAVVQTDPK